MIKELIRPSALIILCFIVIFPVLPAGTSRAASLAERNGLIAFYNSTDGDNWVDNSGWLGASGTECSWTGITCDSSDSITEITLWFNNIAGPLPPEFAGLSSLVLLDLFDNAVNDISVLGSLTNLTHLYLEFNQVTSIDSLSNLVNLSVLALDENPVADTSVLADLTGLTQLSLYDIGISDITVLSDLTLLTELVLGMNDIAEINALSNLTGLTHLYLEDNLISNISPLVNLEDLDELDITGNCIVDFSAVSHVRNIIGMNSQTDTCAPPSTTTTTTSTTLPTTTTTTTLPPDLCPEDPDKTEPGVCGCGVSDADSDSDGIPDCNDSDNTTTTTTTLPGATTTTTQPSATTTTTGTIPSTTTTTLPQDLCPDDPGKTEPGICGCGASDMDTDNDGIPDCNDACPDDPDKTEPGTNGCGISEEFVFPGSGMEVSPAEHITVIFEEIVTGGLLHAEQQPKPGAPSGFRFAGEVFAIDFTGAFTGMATVCLGYEDSQIRGDENEILLMHRVDSASEWQDITTFHDSINNTVCGEVTSFSEFATVEPSTGGGGGGSGCFIATAVADFDARITVFAVICLGLLAAAVTISRGIAKKKNM